MAIITTGNLKDDLKRAQQGTAGARGITVIDPGRQKSST